MRIEFERFERTSSEFEELQKHLSSYQKSSEHRRPHATAKVRALHYESQAGTLDLKLCMFDDEANALWTALECGKRARQEDDANVEDVCLLGGTPAFACAVEQYWKARIEGTRPPGPIAPVRPIIRLCGPTRDGTVQGWRDHVRPEANLAYRVNQDCLGIKIPLCEIRLQRNDVYDRWGLLEENRRLRQQRARECLNHPLLRDLKKK